MPAMPLIAWRLCREPYANLSGEGARRSGARWNPKGRPTVYAGDHPALAVAEYFVHVDDPDDVPDDLLFLRIEVPDACPRETVAAEDLGAGWRDVGAATCLERGTEWLDGQRTPVLLVPSAVVPVAQNVLLNPLHPGVGVCQVLERLPYVFEPRLLR